jgi:NADPH-dependent 2,4-dienoyl-CoA reductase/sulfur reductase-like enzyme
MPERLVVIGCDAAGGAAASQARRLRGPDELEIVALEKGGYTSYSACGIPYWVGDVVDGPYDLIARDPDTFRDRFDIDVRLREEVVEIDLEAREVTVARLGDSGGSYILEYDQLMIGTGAVPVRPSLPGIEAEGIYGIQTLGDGEAVRNAIDKGPKKGVVVGGGYIGMEMAEALFNRGMDVTVLEAATEPMATLDPDMGRLVSDAVVGMGIAVHSNEPVEGFEMGTDGRVRAVVTAEGRYEADVVILGLGVRPNSDLAAEAGVPVGPTGGIRTDRMQKVDGLEGVWAGGDCVETYHLVSRRPVAIALGTHANKQGRVAGINIGGGYLTFPGVVGTAVSKVSDVEIARTGLREKDCQAAGLQYVTALVRSNTRAGYYPGASPISTKIIAEKRTGRLLGAQIVGFTESAKRIDALAIALWNGMTVEELAGTDLSYAPPFSPVWDPILITARKAAEAVEDDIKEAVVHFERRRGRV